MDELSESELFSESLRATAAATARVADGGEAELGASTERIEKIERLKRQVREGTYQVDKSSLSKRIVDEHLND